jgi:3-dehydroquinate synthase
MNSVITVPLPQQAYQIEIGPGGLDQLGCRIASCTGLKPGQKLLLVSNPAIFKHFGQRVETSLAQAGFQISVCLLPAGERYKTLASLQKIYDAALAQRLERGSAMVALGGGVVGDMTGFAAATWLRGIAVVQVPTSLLAMVDAAIGGKTGVNHPQGKNLIGAFHQPRLVSIDPEVLQSLPAREFRAGMAEVIKYGVIWDLPLFEALEAAPRLDQVRHLSPELLQLILTHACQAKADVVSQDEKEAGLRAILNYGHTIGHTIESLTGYRTVNHGEAVAIGMAAAGLLAEKMGLWEAASNQRQQALLCKAGLPVLLPPAIDEDAVLRLLQSDKKVQDSRVRFVLPSAIGQAHVTDQVSQADIRQVLRSLQPAA